MAPRRRGKKKRIVKGNRNTTDETAITSGSGSGTPQTLSFNILSSSNTDGAQTSTDPKSKASSSNDRSPITGKRNAQASDNEDLQPPRRSKRLKGELTIDSKDEKSPEKSNISWIDGKRLAIMTKSGENPRPAPQPEFNLLRSITKHPEICLNFARFVEPRTLCNLYSISKPFHYIMNSHYLTYIRASAEVWAPHGVMLWPFQYYRALCIEDPAMRNLPHNPNRVRHIPSFKWLKMITLRQQIARKILIEMEKAGHLLPRKMGCTLQRIWFTMSFPNNGSRIGILHNRHYWTDKDLFLATLFFIKLDMRFNDPIDGGGETELRAVFIGQPSMLPLLKLLRGDLSFIQIMQYWVLYDYRPASQHQTMSIFGMPASMIGRGCLEGFGRGTQRALRVDEGVMREGIRRDLVFQRHYIDCITYGYQPESDNIPIMGLEGQPRSYSADES